MIAADIGGLVGHLPWHAVQGDQVVFMFDFEPSPGAIDSAFFFVGLGMLLDFTRQTVAYIAACYTQERARRKGVSSDAIR